MGGKNYHGNYEQSADGALRKESLILSAGTEKSEYQNISITTAEKKEIRALSRKRHLKNWTGQKMVFWNFAEPFCLMKKAGLIVQSQRSMSKLLFDY